MYLPLTLVRLCVLCYSITETVCLDYVPIARFILSFIVDDMALFFYPVLLVVPSYLQDTYLSCCVFSSESLTEIHLTKFMYLVHPLVMSSFVIQMESFLASWTSTPFPHYFTLTQHPQVILCHQIFVRQVLFMNTSLSLLPIVWYLIARCIHSCALCHSSRRLIPYLPISPDSIIFFDITQTSCESFL